MIWIFLVSAGVLASLGHIALKHGMTQVGILTLEGASIFQKIPQMVGNLYLWLGFVGFGIALLFWLSGLSHVKLSIAYPVLVGLEYSLVMLFAWLILGETLVTYKLAGVAFVLIGIGIITY
jgi:multidrug transporter EmrE-like cation transporter